jgi:hypothetical protein
MTETHDLERYLPARVRTWVEERYYARISAQSRLEQIWGDPIFLSSPEKHIAMFSDHSVVHVRDVASRILQVLRTINGVLIPARQPHRLETLLSGYGVILAYLHDIGMVDLSPAGRAMHPEYAAQAVFTSAFDAMVETIWGENCGNIAWHLMRLSHAGVLEQPPEQVLREMLSLSIGHSKSKMPIALLDDPAALQAHMRHCIATPLDQLYAAQQAARGRPADDVDQMQPPPPVDLSRLYADFARESFRWLVSPSAELRALVGDVTDTLRALRCADALRQRGTVHKTSGGYEVYISQESGRAEFALRAGDSRLFLLQIEDPLSAGEANIAGTELSPHGDIRISFHCGAFANAAALERAVYAAAYTIDDIQADIIGGFERPATCGDPPPRSARDMRVLIEETDDNPLFATLVQQRLCALNPAMAGRAQVVISLDQTSDLERSHYLSAAEIDAGGAWRAELLARVAQSGHKTAQIDQGAAFAQVRLLQLGAGQRLIEAGAPAAFVYVPLGDGLRIAPLGGYPSFTVRAWMPLGTTGVIRGAIRNATVTAERDVAVLIIPKSVYLRHWHHPYTPQELTDLLQRLGEQGLTDPVAQIER